MQENLQAMKRISFIVAFALACIIGCAPESVRHTLSDIETFIQERPDSALTILDTMDRASLTTARSRAHHALLHAMALDKNFIDVSDDSIAQVAVDYYSKHGPQKYHARSLYYLGLAYYYQEDYNKAIVEFTKAEEIAEGCDSLYLGMLMVKKADTYSKTYNDIETLRILQEAYDIYKAISEDYYVKVTSLKMANAYYNINDFEESERLLNLLLRDSSNVNIISSALTTYAFLKVNMDVPDLEGAVSIYSDLMTKYDLSYMSYNEYGAWAYSLNALGRKEEAQELMDQLIMEEPSGTSSYWQYMIAKSNMDRESALAHLEDYIKHNEREVSDALKQSLALSQRDYYQSQSELSESEAHNARLTSLIIILIAVFSVALVFILIKSYVKRQEEQKEKYLLYISEISRQLEEDKREDYPTLKKKYLSLYRSKFETIGALYEQYIHSKDLVNGESSVYRKVAAIVDDFTLDYHNSEKFEAMLDEDLDNIMTNLRKEMPALKKMDIAIFSLFAIGFDVTTISHLLNTSMNTIYIRKSRIRHLIDETDPPHKEQFLEILDPF